MSGTYLDISNQLCNVWFNLSPTYPHEVAKAIIQLRMLTGRYRVAMLTRHWSPSRSSSCPASDCQEEETLEHLLVFCKYYNHARVKFRRLLDSCRWPLLTELIAKVLYGPGPPNHLYSLYWMPPSTQLSSTLYIYLDRTLFDQNMVLHTLHCERLRLLGLPKFD